MVQYGLVCLVDLVLLARFVLSGLVCFFGLVFLFCMYGICCFGHFGWLYFFWLGTLVS